MQYSILIDNLTAQRWGLNIQEAYVFAWIYSLPSWASAITFSDSLYYFASKNKFIADMPLLTDKKDTVYRYYKRLSDLGLIHSIKVENKDYIRLLDKAKEWNRKSDTSEKNPSSEKNPTNNIIIDKELLDNNNKQITMVESDSIFEELWKNFKSKAISNEGSKAKAKQAFDRQSKATQSKIIEQIEFYIFEFTSACSFNSHLSTYINSRYFENEYFAHEVLPQMTNISADKAKKLADLFGEPNTTKVKTFLAYLEAQGKTQIFKSYINSYFEKVNESGLKQAGFDNVCGTYAKQYKDGKFYKTLPL
jgi:hypothetical protein